MGDDGRKPVAQAALLLAAWTLAGCTPEARPLPEVPAGPAAPAATSAQELGWGYQGALGPDHWASLRPEWAACAGPGQSPIDLPLDALGSAPAEVGPGIAVELPTAALTARSNGQLVSLVGNQLTLVVDGHRSPIESIEVHAPAEHSLGGTTFGAELVFVAKGANGEPLLLSLLLRVGGPNAALAPLLEQLPALRAPGEYPLPSPLTLAALVPASAPVLAYEGSLTTPPCTRALRLVVAQVGELSADQLTALRQAVPPSARPPAERADRPVTLRTLSTPAPSTPPAPTAQP